MASIAEHNSLWTATASPAPPTGPLAGEHEADVVIVGGGFTGLSAALHLAEGGARAVVLEAGELGHGGSGRNVGLVNAGLWLQPEDAENVLGRDAGRRLNDHLSAAPSVVFSLIEKHGIACEAVHKGTIHCAHSSAGLAWLNERTRQFRERGVTEVEILSKEATASMTGAATYFGALLDRRAGTIQPLGYVRGLAAAAIHAGARIHTGTRVTELERVGSVWRVGAGAGHVRAPNVVLATNAYTDQLWPGLQRAFVMLHYSQIASEPLSDNVAKSILPGRQGAWDTRNVMVSFRLDTGNRLILGSIGTPSVSPGGTRRWARSLSRRLFPQLGDLAWQQQWSGQIAMTDDHLPRLNRLAPGLITPIGYNGRGIGPGTVFGRSIARYLLTGNEAELLLPLSDVRTERMRGLRALAFNTAFRTGHVMQRFL